jgi:REP element-mobilizing transposase RayT
MPALFKNKFRIDSTRLKNWDYSTPWWYYVTICTKNMRRWFGDAGHGKIVLNDVGTFVDEIWKDIPKHYQSVELDYYTIMPNHVHGIIILNDVETGHAPSLQQKRASLGNVVGSFKSKVTNWAHNNEIKSFAWQPRFYDHIIRNEKDLHRIRTYIQNNPLKWELDEYYTDE